VLLTAGCVSVKPEDVTRDTIHVTRHESRVTTYQTPQTSHLFRATLDIKKHHLTGMVMIKFMTPPPAPPQTGRGELHQVYRVVFMNEIGITFFDVELNSESFRVVSCFPSLNKKSLFRILETDIRMLLLTGDLENEKTFLQAGTKNMVVSGKQGKYKIWQTYSPNGDTLLRTAAKSNVADHVVIGFESNKEGFPARITIKNPVVGMKLVLRRM
jgi:hypothetical protein